MLPRNTAENVNNESKQIEPTISQYLLYLSDPIFSVPTKKTRIELSLTRKNDFIEGFFKVNTSSYPIKEKIEVGFIDKITAIINKGIEDCNERGLVAALYETYDIYDESAEMKCSTDGRFFTKKSDSHVSALKTQSFMPVKFSNVLPHINNTLEKFKGLHLTPLPTQTQNTCVML